MFNDSLEKHKVHGKPCYASSYDVLTIGELFHIVHSLMIFVYVGEYLPRR